MLPTVEAKIWDAYRLHRVDIDAGEVEDIAVLSLELGVVAFLEMFSPTRFTDPVLCNTLGLRLRIYS